MKCCERRKTENLLGFLLYFGVVIINKNCYESWFDLVQLVATQGKGKTIVSGAGRDARRQGKEYIYIIHNLGQQ